LADRHERTRQDDESPASDPAPQRRPYEAPELVEYGTVAKLTQSGGATTKDLGSMERMG